MDRTEKLSRIRLNQLGKAEMTKRQMNVTRGGNCVCISICESTTFCDCDNVDYRAQLTYEHISDLNYELSTGDEKYEGTSGVVKGPSDYC